MKKIVAFLILAIGSAVAAHAAHPATASSHATATSYHSPKTYSKAAVAHK
ncbi:MAG TPA: hypothetical protein VIJ79_17515 [Acidobacteriaceae bacterium]